MVRAVRKVSIILLQPRYPDRPVNSSAIIHSMSRFWRALQTDGAWPSPASVAVLLILVAVATGRPLNAQVFTHDLPYGGHHEFGVASGYSPTAGAVVGYVENFTYSPIVLRYSYLLRQRNWWAIRYAPEITLLAVLHEKAPSPTNPAAPVTHYGAGISPEGLQLVLLPRRRIQPFVSNAGGVLYFNGRVLSPGGSQFMYTVDLGTGVNLFATQRNAVTFGFRYQHLSNANISHHNPGADAQTFFMAFSHFHTRGVR